MVVRRFQLERVVSHITHIYISTILNTGNRGMECEFALKMGFTKEKCVHIFIIFPAYTLEAAIENKMEIQRTPFFLRKY